MARYIDAELVYETARMFHSDFGQSMADLTSLRELLEEMPTADVVEVVRCKDCKYRGDFSCPMCYEEHIDYDDDGYFESDYILHDRTTDNGFCDYGEKALKERCK